MCAGAKKIAALSEAHLKRFLKHTVLAHRSVSGVRGVSVWLHGNVHTHVCLWRQGCRVNMSPWGGYGRMLAVSGLKLRLVGARVRCFHVKISELLIPMFEEVGTSVPKLDSQCPCTLFLVPQSGLRRCQRRQSVAGRSSGAVRPARQHLSHAHDQMLRVRIRWRREGAALIEPGLEEA